jgi:hypothetical protein
LVNKILLSWVNSTKYIFSVFFQVQAISQAAAGLLQDLLELDGKQDAGSF